MGFNKGCGRLCYGLQYWKQEVPVTKKHLEKHCFPFQNNTAIPDKITNID